MKSKKLLNVSFIFIFLLSITLVSHVYAGNNSMGQNNPVTPPAQNGLKGPQWFNQTVEAPGSPYWFQNSQDAMGPWFWQVYNDFDVSGIAPLWYTDPTTPGAPAWYLNGITGPWWSSYIGGQTTNSVSQSALKNNSSGGMHFQSGSTAPPWYTDPDTFPGNPYWLNNPQEKKGPWFWQAYNGFDVSGIAPQWYIDPTNAAGGPGWFFNETNAPWWSGYILGTGL